MFASYILTLPCVFLACLTLVVFWLPPDRPDRTALGKHEICPFDWRIEKLAMNILFFIFNVFEWITLAVVNNNAGFG